MKKIRHKAAFCALLATAIFFSTLLICCDFGSGLYLISKTPVDERSASVKVFDGNNLPQLEPNSKYSFIVLTDTHFGTDNTDRQEERFLQKFESLLSSNDETLRPQFIVNLGDTMNAGYENQADEFNKTAQTWKEKAKSVLGVSDYKIYSILGNHDLYNNAWNIWEENIWPHTSYYKFSLKSNSSSQGFSFYFLDSANGTLGAPQLEDLEKNLAADSTPKIIFTHYPLYAGGQLYFAMNDTIERNKLISIFAQHNVKYVFEGHTHEYGTYDYKKFKETIVPSYVYEKQFALVTVDEESQKVEYKIISY